MSKKSVQVGDVALIPVRNAFVPAKVLFLSLYFKDVILLGIYNKKLSTKEMPRELPDEFVERVYTSQEPILKGRWISVGHEPLRPKQQGLTKRIVAGEIWLEDETLGPASEIDFDSLPRMQVLGAGLVEKKAANI